MDKLFVPFERLGAAGSGIDGIGLGLALSRNLIEAMHGTMGVESTLGTGSTFHVELARGDAAEVLDTPRDPRRADREGLRPASAASSTSRTRWPTSA